MRRLIPLLCLLAGLAAGAMALFHSKEGPAVNEITGPMRTWAVGRQLIELPADWGAAFQRVREGLLRRRGRSYER